LNRDHRVCIKHIDGVAAGGDDDDPGHDTKMNERNQRITSVISDRFLAEQQIWLACQRSLSQSAKGAI
jgi:hypothetical protein